MLAVIDFLNSREKATLIWAIVLMVIVSVKSDGLGAQLVASLRVLCDRKLLLPFGGAALYCAAAVVLAERVGLWHTTTMKETVYWFVATGAVLVGDATGESPRDSAFAKKLVRKAGRFTIIFEFLANLYVMPFAAELFLVPFIALLVGVQLVAKDSTDAATRRFIDAIVMAMGAFVALYITISFIRDPGGLLTREHAEAFLLAPVLTLVFVPFVYLVAAWSRRDQAGTMRRWRESRQAASSG